MGERHTVNVYAQCRIGFTPVISSRLELGDLRGLLAHRAFGGKTKNCMQVAYYKLIIFFETANCLLRKQHSAV